MTNREKLRLLIYHYGGTQEAFAKRLGVPKETVRSWVARDVITNKARIAILDNCQEVTPEWLDGEFEGFKEFNGSRVQEFKGSRLYTNICATAGQVEQYQELNEESIPFSIPGVRADSFIPVSGCSMIPTINEGDIIGICECSDLDITASPTAIYLIITRDNERMVKHIAEIDEETILLSSDNPNYRPFRVDKENILHIYRVVWHGACV